MTEYQMFSKSFLQNNHRLRLKQFCNWLLLGNESGNPNIFQVNIHIFFKLFDRTGDMMSYKVNFEFSKFTFCVIFS